MIYLYYVVKAVNHGLYKGFLSACQLGGKMSYDGDITSNDSQALHHLVLGPSMLCPDYCISTAIVNMLGL